MTRETKIALWFANRRSRVAVLAVALLAATVPSTAASDSLSEVVGSGELTVTSVTGVSAPSPSLTGAATQEPPSAPVTRVVESASSSPSPMAGLQPRPPASSAAPPGVANPDAGFSAGPGPPPGEERSGPGGADPSSRPRSRSPAGARGDPRRAADRRRHSAGPRLSVARAEVAAIGRWVARVWPAVVVLIAAPPEATAEESAGVFSPRPGLARFLSAPTALTHAAVNSLPNREPQSPRHSTARGPGPLATPHIPPLSAENGIPLLYVVGGALSMCLLIALLRFKTRVPGSHWWE
jgi:hypothetical protein